MKVMNSYFDENLKNKKIRVGKDSFFSEEATIKYTGNVRKIKTIFGKIKEQKEFYIVKKQWSMWNYNTFKIIENGPHWQ